jgi:hypothetical protein
MAYPFATAAEFSEFTGLPVPDDLARWQSHLLMASSVIRAYCHQVLSLVTADVYTAYPTVSSFLSLPERPVTAVSQVLVNGIATTAYYIAPGGRGIRSGTVPSPGASWISGATVTYSHGYGETSDEFSVFREVCIAAVARAIQAPSDGPPLLGISPEATGWATQIFLTEGEKAMLDPFKRGPVR